ncbi:MAG: sulfatase-like hydrolase/transferase, partial [Muribaculaceae bacterium]
MKKAVAYIRSIIVKLWNVDVNIPLFLALFIASILGLIDVLYRAVNMSATFSFVFICLLAVTKTMLVVWLLSFLKGKKHWLWLSVKGLTIMFLVVYVLLCLINGISTILYGFGISHKLFIIAMETTANEVSGFLPSLWANIRGLLTAKALIITILSIALVAVLMVLLKKRRLLSPILSIMAIVGVLGCARMMTNKTASGGYTFQRSSFFMTARIGLYWSHACESMNFIRELQSKVMPLPNADQLRRTEGCTNIVLVLGESALRDQWSLYGYPMETTPCISAMADSLIVFNNAIGSSCSTADNVKHILTFKPDDPNETEWFHFPNIIDLFNTADYYTSWISNQEICGDYSNFSYAVACHADITQYVGSVNSEDEHLLKYDECLLPMYSQIELDDDTPDFAVIHLIGSHTWYAGRFPWTFARFTAADVKA